MMRRLGRQLIEQRVLLTRPDVHPGVTKRALLATTFQSSDQHRRRLPFSQQHRQTNDAWRSFSSYSPTKSHSLHDKINCILNDETTSIQLTQQQMEFCHATLKLYSNTPDQGDTAEALLERMLLQESPLDKLLLGYRWAMRAWAMTTNQGDGSLPQDSTSKDAQQPLPYSVFRANALLERMQRRHEQDPQHHPAPDIAVYDAFLYTCATVTPFSEPVLQLAQHVVHTLEQTGNPHPSTLSYNNVLSIWTNQASYGAASAAEDWLLRLSERAAVVGSNKAQPDTQSFNRVLHAWTQSGEPDRAYAILQFMMQNTNIHVQPDGVSFATVLHGYRTNPEMAEHVFQEAVEYCVARPGGAVNDLTTSLDAAMMAWAYSDRPDAVERVQTLLRDAYLFSLQTSTGSVQLEPTAATHRICLHAYVSDKVDGIHAATRHLHDMIASCRSQPMPTGKKPFHSTTIKNSILTTGAFHVVIQGWLDSSRPEAPDQCRQLLQLMMELSDTHHIPCAPETTTFVRYLQLLWKHKCPPQQALNALEWAEQRRMVNFYVYKLVLQILERSPSYALVAHQVFQRALVQHRNGSIPKLESSAWHRLTMDVLLKQQTRESLELALHLLQHEFPEHSAGALELSYVSVLRTFGRSSPARAGPVAGELYEKMKQSSLIRHNATIGSAVIQTMVQSGDLKYRTKACDLLQEMASHPRMAGPDRASMDACILALLSCQNTAEQPQMVERAIPLLEFLTEHYQQGTVHECPSPSSFRKVFDACLNPEHAQRIQALARSCFPKNELNA